MCTSDKKLSPSDFMKGRRPELFSDTVHATEEYMERDQFEFHLDTLTQRQQEYQFEHFCRRLAEKELCPNLVPQTGPMGGGDAKVDTETYPVAEELALRWYEGKPGSAKERWGFAISAKKDWKSKVKSDVKKIASTHRDYSLVYFITNQSVSSKKRADAEDDLSAEYGIPVRLLDRSWLVEKVVENRRWEIVFSTLDISRPQTKNSTTHGPNDTERLAELEELEALISDQDRYQFSKYQLIEDCLQSALLSRGLGHPRVEIDGRFDRALRIAQDNGANQDVFRVLYNKAWTAYWWLDDFQELDRLYLELAPLVIDSGSAWSLEKVVNLWTAGFSWVRLNPDDSDLNSWDERAKSLKAALLALAMEQTRPTNALWARTQLIFMDLNEAAVNPKNIPSVLKLMSGILDEAEGLLDYPIVTLIQIIEEMSIVGEKYDEYDLVLEKAIDLQASRVGEAEEGKMRLDFGHRKLEAGKPYKAIDQYGKAQFLLAKSEHISRFIESIASISIGYDQIGLLWAARANLIQAFERTLHEHLKGVPIPSVSFAIVRKLVWIEIQLGRIPCILGWIRWVGILSNILELDTEKREKFRNEFVLMDSILGILVLKSDFEAWEQLPHVAGLFDSLNLIMSRAAVLFAMGHEDMYRSEYRQKDEDLQHFFSLWLAQPANDDLPPKPDWLLGQTTEMRTTILGCELTVITENNVTSIVLGETLLAFFESFMASTVNMDGLFATRSNLSIVVSHDDTQLVPFTCQVEQDEFGDSQIRITHHKKSLARIASDSCYTGTMRCLLAMLISEIHCFVSKEQLATLFEEEQAQDRAFWAASMPIAFENVYEGSPQYSMSEWEEFATEERLSLNRKTAWIPTDLPPFPEDPAKMETLYSNKEPQHSRSLDLEAFKHKDIKTLSVINISSWNQARWSGTGYAWASASSPPVMALLFQDLPCAEKIFNGWGRSVTDGSLDTLIDISIIRGINKNNPAHYRVVIGTHLQPHFHMEQNSSRIMLNVIRHNTMEPVTTENLTNFLRIFDEIGSFEVCPGLFDQSAPRVVSFGLNKKKLRVVNAWEIGLNDPLIAALQITDDPVLPKSNPNPSCIEAYEFIRKKSMDKG